MAYGKKVGKYVYLHRSVAMHCEFFDELKASVLNTGRYISWNVLKLDRHTPGSFSLLKYKEFKSSLFPELLQTTVFKDWRYSSWRNYRNAPNPMILHRKELLISEESDYFQEWALLTKQLVALGVFQESKRIGAKRTWLKILQANKEKLPTGEIQTYLTTETID